MAAPEEPHSPEDAPAESASTVTDRPRREILETRQISYSYGSFAAVRDLSLAVRDGEVYGFLGRNGAGKTTTIKMLMGVLKPKSGTVRYFGEEPRPRATVQAKRKIGYVSQQQHFYPWMSGEALGRFVGGLYPDWDAAEFRRLLKLFDVPGKRRSGALSGGMRVKLALALALAPRPELLILDEPMAGLDAVAQREFLDLVQEQARLHGRTTFFSSHQIHEVERIGDRVGIIDGGTLVYEGTIAALQESVRELCTPIGNAAPVMPNGVELLFEEERDGQRKQVIRRAEELDWQQLEFGGANPQTLSLENIFIALVRNSAAQRKKRAQSS